MLSKDPYAYKSAIPHVESKTQQVERGGWGRGLGNNVSDTLRGVNGVAERMAVDADADADKRRQKYAAIRATDAYKLARAQAKRAKRAPRFQVGHPAEQDRAVVRIVHTPRPPVVALASGTCDVAMRDWQVNGLNAARRRK